jgi:hypothetical protein
MGALAVTVAWSLIKKMSSVMRRALLHCALTCRERVPAAYASSDRMLGDLCISI